MCISDFKKLLSIFIIIDSFGFGKLIKIIRFMTFRQIMIKTKAKMRL